MTFPAHLRSAYVWVLLMLCASGVLSAQRQTFRQYGAGEGLKNLAVQSLLQDHIGYLWVGTENGLFRYDGAYFQSFGHAQGLPGAIITSLAESPDGVVWVTTQNGIARFTGEQFQAVDTGQQGGFRSLAFDARGRMYLHQTSGILLGIPDQRGSYRFHTLVRGAIRSMFVTSQNDVLFAKDTDLWRFSSNKMERFGSVPDFPADDWQAITEDSLHNVWIRSTRRLYELAAGDTHFVDRSKGVPQVVFGRLYADRRGRVYVSSDSGLVVIENGLMTLIDAAHGLPADAVAPVLVDREEELLMGTTHGLIRRLGHGEWLSWKKGDGLPHNVVWAAWHDTDDQLWAGTSGGLSILSPQSRVVHSWNSSNGLAGNVVLSIIEGSPGKVLVGTYPAGISEFDRHGFLIRTYRSETGYTAEQVGAMALDRQHRLWAMGAGGCFRSRLAFGGSARLSFDRVKIPGMPPQTSFRNVAVDQNGTVWLATSSGLARHDGKSWKVFTERDGLTAADLEAVVSSRDHLWVAYRDSFGISRLDLSGDSLRATHVTEQDGLRSDSICALAIDLQGRLWVSTDNGVSVLEEGRWHGFSVENGLIWNDTDGPGLSVDSRGTIWIATSNGLSRYTPLPYSIPKMSSPVILTSITGVSQKWRPEDRPVLPYSQRTLYLRYSSLSLASEARAHFRYRLLGYEKTWNDTSERSVNFAALPSGKYVFEVVAENAEGVWSSIPARFVFSIQPPWWRTWWFISASVFLTGLMGYMLWRLRMQVLVNQKNYLERQIADRTKELRESHRQLEEIAFSDALTSLPNRRRFTEELRARLSLARRQGRSLVLLLSDLDRFKQINDTFGHDAGDVALMEAAARLRRSVRESDCVARLGGDEFAILLAPAEGKGEVEAVCRRILDSFVVDIPFKGTSLKLGCSVGIAVFPEDGDTQETLYKSADMAVYEAKRLGRNLFCWHSPESANERFLEQNQVSGTAFTGIASQGPTIEARLAFSE